MTCMYWCLKMVLKLESLYQVEPGGTRWNQVEPGGTRWNQAVSQPRPLPPSLRPDYGDWPGQSLGGAPPCLWRHDTTTKNVGCCVYHCISLHIWWILIKNSDSFFFFCIVVVWFLLFFSSFFWQQSQGHAEKQVVESGFRQSPDEDGHVPIPHRIEVASDWEN